MIEQADHLLSNTDFPSIDPFAATIAQNIDALLNTNKVKTQGVRVELPAFFARPVEVRMALQAGPHAPMMVIFPGTGGDGEDHPVAQLAESAQEQGMNVCVLPNPWSKAWLEAGPKHLPALLPVEVDANQALLTQLKAKFPDYFEHVSAVGTSYGALLGTATVRAEQGSQQDRVINGCVVNISPPENMFHSMHALSHFGDGATASYLDIAETGLQYVRQIKGHGFQAFAASPLARLGDHPVERTMAFTLGPEHVLHQALRLMHLPSSHIASLEDFSNTYLERDPWFAEHKTSVARVADGYEYTGLLHDLQGHGVPVVTLTAKDDFILHADDVARLSQEANHPAPDQLLRSYDHGSHLGLLYNPDIREAVGQIAALGTSQAR